MLSPNLVSKTRQVLSKLWTRKETVRRHTARADSRAKAVDLLSLTDVERTRRQWKRPKKLPSLPST